MKLLLRLCTILAALSLSNIASAAFIAGDVTGGGSVTGFVTSSNAWIASNPIDGDMVNFWTLSGNAGDRVSLFVDSSSIEFGISIYQGVIDQMDLLFDSFNNAGDFGGNVFIAGTNPTTGAIGTTLLDILLPTTGLYTIALGGESGFAVDGRYGYGLQVVVAPVPVPGVIWLLGSALLGLFGMRRKR